MLLKNGIVLNENFEFEKKDLNLADGHIVPSETASDSTLDVSDMYVVPGFIDTHIHGSFGYDVTQGHIALDELSKFLVTQGITSYAPTISPIDIESILDTIKTIAEHKTTNTKIGGIHLEGPFILPNGAINEKYTLPPSVEIVDKFIKTGKGLIKLITIAPELDGIDEVIKHCVKNDITVAIGHTYASYEQAFHAYKLGASQITHTFNALKPLHHRDPGVLGLALSEKEIKCEAICDFVHLHPATVKLLFNTKDSEHINIVSDSFIATGLKDGSFISEGRIYIQKNRRVTLSDGTIAGSALTIYDTLKNVVSIGVPLEKAAKAVTLNPAKTLNIHNSVGSIKIGKKADIVVMDKALNIKYVFIDGNTCYKNE